MANYAKGVEMRKNIIEQSRIVFNKEGLLLTLNQLADKLNITKGRITNYFPTKDKLFVAISQDYDLRFQELLASVDRDSEISLSWLAKVFAMIMDLQYEYRSAIVFVSTTSSSQKDMHDQITKSYRSNSKQVEITARTLVESDLLKPDILAPSNYEVFCFQHVSLFTTWVISQEIYYSTRTYKKMKPVYLRGIIGTYFPYLTPKGLDQFNELFMRS
ncbi:TetR/AcrR family transcriptional regulator [Shivajiella indica]|uniref:TetR/AcrR family transcriptional regulator n=1 Tax=Shivajiella indica TaxID=872115 RepID=A0ABW5B605_9BACT